MRKAETPAEKRLWSRLRSRRLSGLKFVRQEPVGTFIVDFVCNDLMLAIEVDGATHSTEERITSDQRRTKYLNRAGFGVLRFSNEDVYRRLENILETIIARTKNLS
jgi:very-short-patch-repair endonuclease